MPRYTRRNLAAAARRFKEYEEVLSKREFVQLESCDVCGTVPFCDNCIFNYCQGPHGYGADCWDQGEQRDQFKFLVGRVEEKGYKYVDGEIVKASPNWFERMVRCLMRKGSG